MGQIRVLHVIGAMDRAGAETVVMNLMRAVDRDCARFDFLVHTDKRCDYDDEIESLGGSIYRVPRYNIANGASYRRACRQVFEEHPEIQVVHGHIGSCSGVYLDEARRAGCATVVHSHSHRDTPKPANLKVAFRRKLYSSLTEKALGFADEFLACGLQAGIDRFGTEVVEGPHFHIMRNGIDLARYACNDEGRTRAKAAMGFGDEPLVGCVGRLAPKKNQRFLIDAFARALPHIPGAKLLLAGRGPLEGELREQAANLEIGDSVIFLGVIDDVPEMLKALDVFAFPSQLEGLGMAVVEAQAAGAPCIVSTAVPEEAIVTGLAQRLPLDNAVDDWAASIVATIQSGLPRTDATSAVRAAGYDIHDVAEWMTGFYADLARRSERGRAGGIA